MRALLIVLSALYFFPVLAQEPPKKNIKEINPVIKDRVITKDVTIALLGTNWNFESGNLNSWTAQGDAFSNQPTAGGIHPDKKKQRPVPCWEGTRPTYVNPSWNHGIQGNFWVSSGENHRVAADPLSRTFILNTTGSMVSNEFVLKNDYISFLLSGQSNRLCRVELLVADDGTLPATDSVFSQTTQVVGNRPVTILKSVPFSLERTSIGGKNYFIVSAVVNPLHADNDIVFTAKRETVERMDQDAFKRTSILVRPKYRNKTARIRVVDNDASGFIAVDDFRFENTLSSQPVAQVLTASDCPLQGVVDLHTHPMSYLGFGKKAVHGALDSGSLIPAGTRGCNSGPFRARNMQEALGDCNSTHGGWGVDNGCGDYLRAAIINLALDADFVHVLPLTTNAHGDHPHAGAPNFAYWPHHSSILHQQMWVDWIRRAHAGGIRSIVALTVNNELLANITNGDGPYDDKTVANEQIDEMIAFVGRHTDFMEIARTPADYRRIIRAGKLAVILGMEVDQIGNFGKNGVTVNEATVRAEIRRLYDKGIRYIFPVHLVDNSFGGTSVYSTLFNFANKSVNGSHFTVEHAPDPAIQYTADIRMDGTPTPAGLDNGIIFTLRSVLEGIGGLPSPCIDPGCISNGSAPGTVRCCGSYGRILNVVKPSPELDAYKFIPGGHRNAKVMTSMGEIAINEMMRLGIMIDVDHMGEKTMTRAIEIAEGIPGGYPLMMGHNAIRGTNEHTMKERSAPPALVRRLSALGGMFGVGTSDLSAGEFVENSRNALTYMANRSIAIGTDVNGFERLPKIDGTVTFERRNRVVLANPLPACRTGNKTWNYFDDGGVAHYGMMPEFLLDAKLNVAHGEEVYRQLQFAAENMALLWEKIERVKGSVR